jgi:hypothetical protein
MLEMCYKNCVQLVDNSGTTSALLPQLVHNRLNNNCAMGTTTPTYPTTSPTCSTRLSIAGFTAQQVGEPGYTQYPQPLYSMKIILNSLLIIGESK